MKPPRQLKQWFAVFLLVHVIAGIGSAEAQSSKGAVSGRLMDSGGAFCKAPKSNCSREISAAFRMKKASSRLTA